MLPLPVSFRVRQPSPFSRPHRKSYRTTRDVLLTRARVTNLGLLLLAGFAALSFLTNLGFYLTSGSSPEPYHKIPLTKPLSHARPSSILSTVQRDPALSGLSHLIIVPGHAIWKGVDPARRLDEDDWILESYQRGGGRVAAFYNHIAAAADLAQHDNDALVVFSGGQTRPSSTTTEAESYMRLALAAGILPTTSSAASKTPVLRATTENYALDSYQNLLFSIARFHEYTGHYPRYITVVGYEMKRRRFTELHRAALRWPDSRFNFIGIDAEGEEALAAREGEKQNGYLPYSVDTYGCHDFLQSKRRGRNPFTRFHPYHVSCPELVPLLEWCPGPEEGGQTAVFDGRLPWYTEFDGS